MSLIIKGIDMPKEYTIRIDIKPDGTIWEYEPHENWVKHEGSAIQIPKGHGRLIDADKLESHEEFDGYGFTKSVYEDDINDTPTILEAEGE